MAEETRIDRIQVQITHAGKGTRWARCVLPVAIDSTGTISCPGICVRPEGVEGSERAYRWAEEAGARAYHEVTAQTAAAPPEIHWIEVEIAIPDPDQEIAVEHARQQLVRAKTRLKISSESWRRSKVEVARLETIDSMAEGDG